MIKNNKSLVLNSLIITSMLSIYNIGYSLHKESSINSIDTTEITKISDDKNFIIEPYHTNYLLPFFYSPYLVKNNIAINDDSGHKTKVKFQLSMKANIWNEISSSPISLYLSYTQKSYWQFYAKSAFFQETNYEPSLFFSYDYKNKDKTFFDYLHFGYVHQSNGRGAGQEVSWNRLFADAKFNIIPETFFINLRPWLRVDNALGMVNYNPDITSYLGDGDVMFSLWLGDFQTQLITRNNIESGFERGSLQLELGYNIYQGVKVFTQIFTGYGESLNSYNIYTNSIGFGFALSNIL